MIIPYRRIVRAISIVFLTWMAVALYWAWRHEPALFSARIGETPWRASWVIGVFGIATAAALLLEWHGIHRVARGLRGMESRGASTTLGIIPEKAPPPRTKSKAARDRLAALLDQFDREREDLSAKAQAKHPPESSTKEPVEGGEPATAKKYGALDTAPVRAFLAAGGHMAELFLAVFSILDASDLPASPKMGSHGDNDLVTHSMRLAILMANHWREVNGVHQTVPGDVAKPAQSRAYSEALAIVTGLAHDIGKVQTFQRGPEGITVIGLHDMIGGRMLATLPEYWDLNDDYQQRIMAQAIRYYHHPRSYPGAGNTRRGIVTDKAVTQLMEAIRRADYAAGAIEGRAEEVMADYLAEDELPERDLDEQVWETFLAILAKDRDAINHKSPQRRIGYKQGPVLYLIEKVVRERIVDDLSITRSDYTEANNGNPGKLIRVIADRLRKQNALITNIMGREASPAGAAVYVAFHGVGKSGDAVESKAENIPHYMVRLDTGPFAELNALADYPSSIIVTRPVWPQYLKKNPTDPDTEVAYPGPERDPSTEASHGAPDDGDGEATEEEAGDEAPWAAEDAVQETAPQTQETEAGQSQLVSVKEEAQAQAREQRRRELEKTRLRTGDGVNRERSSIVAREMMTEEQRLEALRERTRRLLDRYPEIMPFYPGNDRKPLPDKTRKGFLLCLIWLDELRRDYIKAKNVQVEDYATIRMESLLAFSRSEKLEKTLLNLLESMGNGDLFIAEIRTRIVLRIVKGAVDLHETVVIAPVQQEDHATEQVASNG
ncbi:metal-dependent phosphohydrolase [Acidithiobacillus ferriphilus]|uniref:metal-dependent phosphohydrolase n=1 Tax=Acidithiobacillus ferriphilus TaxID=1689834 RepID=UPI001C064648|nr:metal-dependent phosphohydrolase [Acidithiobacillus ferriphilus]MBU2785120.1 metal-dependent phosphohydrolase [Acidithiobacillus ferriphilus]